MILMSSPAIELYVVSQRDAGLTNTIYNMYTFQRNSELSDDSTHVEFTMEEGWGLLGNIEKDGGC